MSISYDFPDRSDRRLYIGDCTPVTGDCPGHPVSTHAGCKSMDTNYYTLGINNTTQYIPYGIGVPPELQVITVIWDTVATDINTDTFDWERNYFFMKRIASIFPSCSIMTQNILRDYMVTQARSKYGYNETNWMSGHVSASTGIEYNHHLHIHFSLGGNFNSGLDLRSWII